ncbi:3-ketoacyl-CoA thiolase B, peroxisomal [Smittium mucronatum]|uniref:3-ketoacyl-CoA thiolase B, peroxisomal n=1 Tax=Smittium mucronatum TaxID=133383 RepID=A0A1R0GTQ2_9FUNG|nr:3-ketoacyl-CoA thiolase B, peroxisomal [Smittium mucronatum]
MASARLEQIGGHLAGVSSRETHIGVKNPNDVVIVSCCRTPICRAKKGHFKDTTHEYLLSVVLKEVVQRVGLDPALVQDIIVGNVLPPGSGANLARMAMLYANFPCSTSVMTVNRQCSSGLQAVSLIASCIKDGAIDIGIGAGVESMTSFYKKYQLDPKDINSKMLDSNSDIADCLMPMGQVSENVAMEFGVSRTEQDEFSVESHKRADYAQRHGYFDKEIVPVTTTIKDTDGRETKITVTKDDGVRPSTTFEVLSKIKPAFKKEGTTTAGNSSQVSDGAAAVLLMKRSKAIELGLPILGKYVCSSVYGVPPRINGIGPIYAIPDAARKAGIPVSDISIIELNEAFASQAVYCKKFLNLDSSVVNPSGGAIALGHPLGATGARQVSTLIYGLKRAGQRVGAISMCIGTGMGMCSIFENE